MSTDLSQTIEQNACGPADVQIDGQRVRQRPIKEVIEADRYLASKEAVQKGHLLRRFGLVFAKISPPGAV